MTTIFINDGVSQLMLTFGEYRYSVTFAVYAGYYENINPI